MCGVMQCFFSLKAAVSTSAATYTHPAQRNMFPCSSQNKQTSVNHSAPPPTLTNSACGHHKSNP